MATSRLECVEECAACQGTSFRHFATSDDLQIVRCTTCSLLFSNPRIPEADLRRFFSSAYFETRGGLAKEMTEHRRKPLERTARIVRALRPQGGRLLDIGAATGAFIGLMAGYPGWTVEGVEPSAFAAGEAARRHHVPIHHGYLDQVSLPERGFDVITMLDVFFLDPAPHRTLTEARRLLAPFGYLAIEIPGLNFRLLKNTGMVARLWYGRDAQLNPAMQMFYYDHRTLARILQRHRLVLTARHAEQSPIYGGLLTRAANELYFRTTRTLFRATGGRIHYAPKELLIFRALDP